MAQDAVTVAPHIYKVVLENDRVRVLDVRSQQGDKSEMHSHPDAVAIAIQGGAYRFALPDGESMEIELAAGDVAFTDAVEHTTEQISTDPARVILVELK